MAYSHISPIPFTVSAAHRSQERVREIPERDRSGGGGGGTEGKDGLAGVGLYFKAGPNGRCYVYNVMKGTSADLNGIVKVGDVIVEVDAQNVAGKPLSTLRKLILGTSGTTVNLAFVRYRGEESFQYNVDLTRGDPRQVKHPVAMPQQPAPPHLMPSMALAHPIAHHHPIPLQHPIAKIPQQQQQQQQSLQQQQQQQQQPPPSSPSLISSDDLSSSAVDDEEELDRLRRLLQQVETQRDQEMYQRKKLDEELRRINKERLSEESRRMRDSRSTEVWQREELRRRQHDLELDDERHHNVRSPEMDTVTAVGRLAMIALPHAVSHLHALSDPAKKQNVSEGVTALLTSVLDYAAKMASVTLPQSVTNLVNTLEASNDVLVCEATYAVALVSVEYSGRMALLRAPNCTCGLADVLNRDDRHAIRFAALALANLAMDPEGRQRIAATPMAIHRLLEHASLGETEIQRVASMALGNLLLEPEGCAVLLQDSGCVDALLSIVRTAPEPTRGYAVGALRNLAADNTGRTYIETTSGAIDMLRSLVAAEELNPKTRRFAEAALANLSLPRSSPGTPRLATNAYPFYPYASPGAMNPQPQPHHSPVPPHPRASHSPTLSRGQNQPPTGIRRAPSPELRQQKQREIEMWKQFARTSHGNKVEYFF